MAPRKGGGGGGRSAGRSSGHASGHGGPSSSMGSSGGPKGGPKGVPKGGPHGLGVSLMGTPGGWGTPERGGKGPNDRRLNLFSCMRGSNS